MSVRALSPALAEKARATLNEDENRLKNDIQHLKDWIAKQPHLRARTDDQWLVAFLRGCKYSLERTKAKLDLYYSCCTAAPELTKVKHSVLDEFLSLGVILILPETVEPDSSRVTIFRPGKWNPDKYHLLDIMAIIWNLTKVILMDDDHTTVSGSVSVVDLEGVSMSLMLQCTPTALKKMSVFAQDASPVRLMGVHFMNTPSGFETVFNMGKTFLSEKHKSRFHAHNQNFEELYKHIPKDMFPVEYGGNNVTTHQQMIDDFRNKVKEYIGFLEEESQFGTDEAKRPGRPRTAEDMFGAEGSFRVILILPKTVEPNSPRVTIMRPGKWNPDTYHLLDILPIIWNLAKITLMEDDHTTVSGSVSILDLEGVSMSLLMQCTPSVLKKITVFAQDANPVRVMGAHFLNTPSGFETVFNIGKSFLSEKHKSRFYVHNQNYEELYKHIPKDILPVEYGGSSSTTQQELIDNFKIKVKEYSAFLEEESQFGTDEAKRPGRPRTAEDMFGAEGSFRKLEFD